MVVVGLEVLVVVGGGGGPSMLRRTVWPHLSLGKMVGLLIFSIGKGKR